MPRYEVTLLAVESDEPDGMYLGEVVVDCATEQEAMDKAREALWDDRLSVTCNERYRVKQIAETVDSPSSPRAPLMPLPRPATPWLPGAVGTDKAREEPSSPRGPWTTPMPLTRPATPWPSAGAVTESEGKQTPCEAEPESTHSEPSIWRTSRTPEGRAKAVRVRSAGPEDMKPPTWITRVSTREMFDIQPGETFKEALQRAASGDEPAPVSEVASLDEVKPSGSDLRSPWRKPGEPRPEMVPTGPRNGCDNSLYSDFHVSLPSAARLDVTAHAMAVAGGAVFHLDGPGGSVRIPSLSSRLSSGKPQKVDVSFVDYEGQERGFIYHHDFGEDNEPFLLVPESSYWRAVAVQFVNMFGGTIWLTRHDDDAAEQLQRLQVPDKWPADPHGKDWDAVWAMVASVRPVGDSEVAAERAVSAEEPKMPEEMACFIGDTPERVVFEIPMYVTRKRADVDECPTCFVKLVEGQAFVMPPPSVNEMTTDLAFSPKPKLVACMKCPTCGHSEEMPEEGGEEESEWDRMLRGAGRWGRVIRPMDDAARAHYELFGEKGLHWDEASNRYVIDIGDLPSSQGTVLH